ncbi:hypothetical protein L6452_21879 [Arctium lappa]|uniref:Uncharacterized protein n=1 Tax=Arctium lappa TaxID=4217 RepID=A0ACB9AXN3_ARCLA|nr:hypothetical protein L6452_21879 [Arctium lappa]
MRLCLNNTLKLNATLLPLLSPSIFDFIISSRTTPETPNSEPEFQALVVSTTCSKTPSLEHNLKFIESESEYLFNKIDPYLDIDLKTPNQKPNRNFHRYNSPTDGVVPVQNKNNNDHYQIPPHEHLSSDVVVEGLPAYDIDYTGSKPFMYNFTSQSISQSVLEAAIGDKLNLKIVFVSFEFQNPWFKFDDEKFMSLWNEEIRKMISKKKTDLRCGI